MNKNEISSINHLFEKINFEDNFSEEKYTKMKLKFHIVLQTKHCNSII